METVRQFLINQVVEIGRAVLMLLVPLPLMFAIDPRMTGVSLVLIPVIFGFSIVFFQKVRNRFEAADKAEGRLTSALQENLTGIRVVRAFARQEYEIQKFGARNREHRDLDYRLYWVLAGFWSTSDLLCMAQIAIVVFTGGMWLANGTLAAGSFLFFLSVVNMFIWPVRMMGRILTELGKATVAIGRIQDVLGHARESIPPGIDEPVTDRLGEIVFDDVTFSHRNGIAALDQVTALAFQAGITRVATLLGARDLTGRTYQFPKSPLFPEGGASVSFHGGSHHQDDPAQIKNYSKLNRYHLSTTAYFAEKLKSIPDGDGTLLDHSLILHGTNMGNSNQHQHYDVPHFLIGGANGKLKGNRHLAYERKTVTTGNLLLSILDMFDIHLDQQGDSTGRLASL